MPGSETTESGLAGANEPNLGNFMVSKRQGYGLSHTALLLDQIVAMQGTAQLSMPRNARPARGAGADSWNWYTPG
jgi:hypothetical protein